MSKIWQFEHNVIFLEVSFLKRSKFPHFGSPFGLVFSRMPLGNKGAVR